MKDYEYYGKAVYWPSIPIRKAKEKLDPRFATDEELRDFIMEFKVIPASIAYSQPAVVTLPNNPTDSGKL
jgi:hypothetical protein